MGWWMNNQSRQALWLALAGSIVLMIGMGYGRFAFTGVLPLMLNEGLLTLHEGNLAASANYAGYLVGALLLARVRSYYSETFRELLHRKQRVDDEMEALFGAMIAISDRIADGGPSGNTLIH